MLRINQTPTAAFDCAASIGTRSSCCATELINPIAQCAADRRLARRMSSGARLRLKAAAEHEPIQPLSPRPSLRGLCRALQAKRQEKK